MTTSSLGSIAPQRSRLDIFISFDLSCEKVGASPSPSLEVSHELCASKRCKVEGPLPSNNGVTSSGDLDFFNNAVGVSIKELNRSDDISSPSGLRLLMPFLGDFDFVRFLCAHKKKALLLF